MWIFTTDGFYSAVQLDTDTTKLLIRARARDDLERLCAKIGVDPSTITSMTAADYEYRVGLNGEISKALFNAYVMSQIDEIDYTSHCKEEMTMPTGVRESDRYQWYLKSWSSGLAFQDGRLNKDSKSTIGSRLRQVWPDDWLDTDGYFAEDRSITDTLLSDFEDDPDDSWTWERDLDDLDPQEEVSSASIEMDLTEDRFISWCEDNGFYPSFTAMDLYIEEQVNP